MKSLNVMKAVASMIAILASTSAISATAITKLATTQLTANILQPLRFAIPQQINPVIKNNFALATKDYKTFHGSMCQPYNGDQQGDLDHRDNGLYNESDGTRTVVCPIVRDNVNVTSGVWATIYVNNPVNKTFSCWLDSRGPYGNVITWVNRQTTLSGDRSLFIDVYNMVQNGNFNLYCRVPAKGRIASYKTGENLRTDLNN